MKNHITYLTFILLFSNYLCKIPTWNLDTSSIDLFEYSTKYIYSIYSNVISNTQFDLSREISKVNNDIKINTYFSINNTQIAEVEWDDINSINYYEDKFYICPEGKNHLYKYEDNEMKAIIHSNFNIEGDWKLICHLDTTIDRRYLFISYLSNKLDLYQFDLKEDNFFCHEVINEHFFDYKWNSNNMFSLEKTDNNELYIKNYYFNTSYKYFTFEKKKTRKINELKYDYYRAYFNKYNDNFFYISYNEFNDINSGYYNQGDTITVNNMETINIINNNVGPFDIFCEDITIYLFKYIYNNRYIYYEIKRDYDSKKLYGIIDVQLNSIIFNTEQEILAIKSIDSNSFAAITYNSLYQICVINNGDNCTDSCEDDQILLLDPIKGNHCGNECDNYILKPNNICIDSCDNNIYINNGKECGLCKDLGGENKYKLINSTGCLKSKPENSYYFNEEFLIVSCDYAHPYFEEQNCVEKCSEGYFEQNNICVKCNEPCKTCTTSADTCQMCIERYYLEEKNCKPCSNYCLTCNKGEENGLHNCLSCDINSEFKYFLNNDCLKVCPNDYVVENLKCIKKKEEQTADNTKGEDHKSDELNISHIIFIVLTAVMLLIILICTIRTNKFFKSRESSHDILMTDIEFKDMKKIVN